MYKNAETLFASDSQYGTQFLNELTLIPSSAVIADEDWWDSFAESLGFTSDYEQAYVDAFNTALDEIRALVNDYHSFKNSLPSTQIEQQKEAGFNAAVTGEGVDASSRSSDANLQPNTSAATYTNQQLSDGITNFVNFIGSVSNLLGTGANAASLIGNLGIAQESHDLSMAKEGVTPTSGKLSRNKTVQNIASVASAGVSAHADFLKGSHSVPIGGDNDPNTPLQFQVLTGYQVMQELAKYRIINTLGSQYVDQLKKSAELQYGMLNSTLEQEYLATNYDAMTQEGQFTSDFFKARSGAIEGANETSLSSALKNIKLSEEKIKAFEEWLADYKYQTLYSWGEQLSTNPTIAPYLYKGIFDFGMADTFYHQSSGAMWLKYGMENLSKGADTIGAFFGAFSKGKKPPMPKKRTTTESHGPKGTTITETITEVID